MPPTHEPHLFVADALIAFAGVVVLFYAWRGLGGLPLLARITIGAVLTAIVAVGFGAVILTFGDARREFDGDRQQARIEPELPASQPAPRVTHRVPEPIAAAPQAASPPPPPPARSEAKAPEPRSLAPQNGDWDVVPVFYGTDRASEPGAKRVQYGFERGRRLELGRALVTVPRAHQVPQIERPWAMHLPFIEAKIAGIDEDPKRHFTMREIKVLSREQFLAEVAERLQSSQSFKDHAVVFVHGYNTAFDYAVYRTAQIAYDLKFDGVPFLFSWPSVGKMASYTYDHESAAQSAPYLREFLEMVVAETGAKSVSIIAHSMGNGPLLAALKDLKAASRAGIAINQIILAAPDVDRDNFENLAKAVAGFANGVTLYAAANDHALTVSRRFHGGVPRAGDVPQSGPLVLSGIDTIDVTATGTDGFALNHSGYAESHALLNDIGLLIQTGERPPDKRIPILQRVKTAKGGEYWRYPALH